MPEGAGKDYKMKIYRCAERKSRNPCARIEPGRVRFEISAGPERLQGQGLEVQLCLGSVLLQNMDSNRYCRQGPKRQFASRKFKFKLAARPPAAPARRAPRPAVSVFRFRVQGPSPGCGPVH